MSRVGKKFLNIFNILTAISGCPGASLFYIGSMKQFLLALTALALFTAPALAQPAAKDAPLPPEKPVAETAAEPAGDQVLPPDASREDVKQLIETLESETARTELLSNLKLLLDEQKKEEAAQDEILVPLTEQIGVRGFFTSMTDGYDQFLTTNNLSGSLVNQVLGSVIVMIIVLLLLAGEKRIHQKINAVCDKIKAKFGSGAARLPWYAKILHWIMLAAIYIVAAFTLAKIWDITLLDRIFDSELARAVIPTALTIMVVIFLAVLLWEAINLTLTYTLLKADTTGNTRSKTLLPIIRNLVFMVFIALFGLVLLSELGINVTPLLAGAGVIGVAVGFGAQSMVKDYLSGFTIVLEDLVRVGDVVNLGGFGGSVEKITLRKIQIRDFAGTVYTIPYSEIKVIQNLTKDFSFYVMDISVAYHASIDHVISVLRSVDEEMRKDERFSFMILEPLEIAGVDKFADSAIVIKCRIKTAPIRQWAVGREFNKRMKMAFDREGIEIPFPQRTINIRNSADTRDITTAILEEVSE